MEKSEKKQFNRTVFEKIKAYQARNWSREAIMKNVGFGRETVRKALAAPNWSQYRKNELKALRKRLEKRQASNDNQDHVFEDPDESEQYIETPQSPHRMKAPFTVKVWMIVLPVTVAVIALVLYLIVKSTIKET